MSPDEIASAIKLPEKSLPRFNKIIAELISEGELIEGKKGRLYSARAKGFIKGTLRANSKGFAFLIREDSSGEDIYIGEDNLGGAINGDTVLVRTLQKNKTARIEGAVTHILAHAQTKLVGKLCLCAGLAIVEPDDERLPKEIFISSRGLKGEDGQKVLVRITDYCKDGTLRGEIEEILGYPDDFGVDVLSIIKSYDFGIAFPQRVMREAELTAAEVSADDTEGRLDLRGELLITIDGADSKDLDDAISLSKTENGYKMGVHIADVSHYVRPGSALDKEALERGTSVYLVDRVIPMLSPKLSNGICSLNEGVDRLAMSVLIDMDSDGRVLSSSFHKAVIRSRHRMTYSDVWAILNENDAELTKKYADVVPMLREMYELSLKLRRRSAERGYLELELPEAKAVLDENGKAVGIELRKTNGANELIEQFMVSANMEVAKYLHTHQIPAIYRVHGAPSEEKLAAVRSFAASLGYRADSTEALLAALRGKPEEPIVTTMVLRSMAKAIYSPANSGHYGLGAEYYCHFTSPIRRYPDLVCHRALKAAIEHDEAAMRRIGRMNADTAEANSERELAAERCERDTLDLKKAEYMEQFVGQEFKGIISSVTSFGFFVALENTVEGLVPINSLIDDYYVYDEANLALRGERTHREFKIGDSAEVILAGANKQRRKIDFVLKEMTGADKASIKAKKRKEEANSNGGSKKRNKNSRTKQKRISRVFHRRKARGRH